MIRALIGAAVVLVLSTPAHAQTATVSGTIVDESGAPVPGATVTLTGSGIRLFSISDAHGGYVFRDVSRGSYSIAVSLSGFATVSNQIVVGDSSSVEVPAMTLRIGAVTETVTVSASKVESALINAPATMTVVSSEVLASTSAQNYGDLLRSVPGVNVIQMSARDVNLTSREATSTLSNSQLVVVDGRSIVLDFFGLVLWDFIPTNQTDISQVEVIRGPASAVWGANALTGVVNVITKPPRQTLGTTVTLTGGLFSRDAGSGIGRGAGGLFGANATVARAPNDRWSYRISAGYFKSDPMSRPVGQIPVISDPRDPTRTVGGAFYPIDGTGAVGTAFQNKGTSQPKFDVRADQEIGGGRITYSGGVAGTEGLIHTGLGPFDIRPGSYMGYGKVSYNQKALKVNAFANFVDADAPSVLLNDPTTGLPLKLTFTTQTYDLELGHALVAAKRHAISYGGNVRHNDFNIAIAPTAKSRNEVGAYVQDEVFFDKVRFTIGGRVDKFGNISDPVFSPRLTATFKPASDHAIRVSYNKAFRSPSMLNNYEDIHIVVPTDLSGLAPLLPPQLQPAVAAPFPLVIRAVGSNLPIGTTPQEELTEESLTAVELAYIGTFRNRTTLAASVYVNDHHHSINFTQLPANLDPYTDANPPPGWPLPPGILGALAQQGIFLPRTAFTYLNLGPLRQKGVELSADHRIAPSLSTFVNYSWQGEPTPLPDPHPFPTQELELPPTHRFNVGFNLNGSRLLGSASINYSSRAFWADVLSSPFHGFSDPYTLVNGSFGVKWADRKVTTLIKVTNLFNQDVQQHIFGDILKRSGTAEVQFKF
jgi:outer membrane receptor protein involved in Fe transport